VTVEAPYDSNPDEDLLLDGGNYWEQYEAWQAEVDKKYSPSITQICMPDTLRLLATHKDPTVQYSLLRSNVVAPPKSRSAGSHIFCATSVTFRSFHDADKLSSVISLGSTRHRNLNFRQELLYPNMV